MIQKILLFALAIFVSLPFGIAQQPDSTLIPTEKSLLWKIEGASLETPSYLFGTIHIIPKADYILRESVKTALASTRKITFEINMDDMNDMSIIMSLMTKIFMKNDTTLQDLLSPVDYSFVTAYFKKSSLPLPIEMLGKIKPMFLTMLDPEAMGGFDVNSGASVSYEVKLHEIAKQQEKEMGGLETVDYQIGVFDKIPYKTQAEMLVEGIRAGKDTSTIDQLTIMVDMYKKQDIQAMQTLMQTEDGGMGDFEDVLLTNRNKNWIPIMSKMMREKPTFFAVGAGHLGGQEGVIALLRAKGYVVTAVK